MGRRIDVQSRLAGRLRVPGAGSIEQAIAQNYALETGGSEHLSLHVGGAFDRHRPRRVGKVERISLGMRLAACRIAEGDALPDETPRPGGLRRRNEMARAFDANARVLRI